VRVGSVGWLQVDHQTDGATAWKMPHMPDRDLPDSRLAHRTGPSG
jgi:hypothetical protein